MITKDWKKRLELVTNDRLTKIRSLKENIGTQFEQDVEDILKMRMGHQAKFDEIEKLNRTKDELRLKMQEIGVNLSLEIDKCLETIKSKGIFLAFNKSQKFKFKHDHRDANNLTQNYLYEISGDLKMGFPRNLFILVRMSNDETNYTEIEICGIFQSISPKYSIKDPINFCGEVVQDRPGLYSSGTKLKTINIFKGIVDFDELFSNYLSTQIIKLIKVALERVEKTVQNELQRYEDMAKNTRPSTTIIFSDREGKSIIIDRL